MGLLFGLFLAYQVLNFFVWLAAKVFGFGAVMVFCSVCCCSVLQCVEVCCQFFWLVAKVFGFGAVMVCCSVLQCVAVSLLETLWRRSTGSSTTCCGENAREHTATHWEHTPTYWECITYKVEKQGKRY